MSSAHLTDCLQVLHHSHFIVCMHQADDGFAPIGLRQQFLKMGQIAHAIRLMPHVFDDNTIGLGEGVRGFDDSAVLGGRCDDPGATEVTDGRAQGQIVGLRAARSKDNRCWAGVEVAGDAAAGLFHLHLGSATKSVAGGWVAKRIGQHRHHRLHHFLGNRSGCCVVQVHVHCAPVSDSKNDRKETKKAAASNASVAQEPLQFQLEAVPESFCRVG